MLRDPLPSESQALIALGVATGLFSPDEAQALLGDTLDAFHGGRLGADHRVSVWSEAAASTPRFYERLGYARCGEVPDFYSDGDGKVIFARRVVG
jgi:ribosomal protein S18 acetylase RimI-like enzyme